MRIYVGQAMQFLILGLAAGTGLGWWLRAAITRRGRR